jgi:hypothetical protein
MIEILDKTISAMVFGNTIAEKLNDILKYVGFYYRDRREDLELTQKELAEMAFIPLEDVRLLEAGKGKDFQCAIYYLMLTELNDIKPKDIYYKVKNKGCSNIEDNNYILLAMVLDIDLKEIFREALKEIK